jgi:hypothetical protein
VYPGTFSDEHFYWVANAGTTATQGGTGLVLALEGAFAVGPAIAGDQIVFGRVRIRIAIVPVNDAPVAINDSIGAANNKAATINVLANATIPGIARGSYSAYHSRSKDPMILPP